MLKKNYYPVFTFVLNISLFILFYISYIDFVHPLFSYLGFGLSINNSKLLLSFFIFLLLSFFLTRKIFISSFVIYYYHYFLLLPALILFGVTDLSFEYLLLYLIPYIIISIFFYFATKNITPLLFHFPSKFPHVFLLILVVISFFLLLRMFLLNFDHINLNLDKIYELRGEVGANINTGVWGYLNNWLPKVFIPIIFIYFYFKFPSKKFFLLACLLLTYILIFSLTTHKSYVFFFLFQVLVFLLFRYKSLVVIPLLIFSLISISILSFLFLDDIYLSSLTIRRAFFVPAYLSSLYLDFFSNFDHVYWSNSFLSPFIDYPYSNIYTKLLSDFYWDKSTGTNNGFISVGFMHASWFGVLAYTIIFIFMIHFLDRISFFSVDRSFVVLFLSIIPLQILLSSADLLTALSTHGLFFSLISIPIVLQFLFGSSRSYD